MTAMNTPNLNYQFDGPSSLMPAFSAYNFLRNCNYIFESRNEESRLKGLREPPFQENQRECRNLLSKHLFAHESLLTPYPHSLQLLQRDPLHTILPSLSPTPNYPFKKHRGEKKPIPEEQKDDKYFERRRRNNQAAKKSRDARKMREDQIALRVTILEHENAILRAQLIRLQEEASSLRQLLLPRKSFEVPTSDNQLCVISQ